MMPAAVLTVRKSALVILPALVVAVLLLGCSNPFGSSGGGGGSDDSGSEEAPADHGGSGGDDADDNEGGERTAGEDENAGFAGVGVRLEQAEDIEEFFDGGQTSVTAGEEFTLDAAAIDDAESFSWRVESTPVSDGISLDGLGTISVQNGGRTLRFIPEAKAAGRTISVILELQGNNGMWYSGTHRVTIDAP